MANLCDLGRRGTHLVGNCPWVLVVYLFTFACVCVPLSVILFDEIANGSFCFACDMFCPQAHASLRKPRYAVERLLRGNAGCVACDVVALFPRAVWITCA